MDEEQYRELLAGQEESYIDRVRATRVDVAAGRVQRFTSTEELMSAIEESDTGAQGSPGGLRTAAGSISIEEAERLKTLIYHGREEGTRPASSR